MNNEEIFAQDFEFAKGSLSGNEFIMNLYGILDDYNVKIEAIHFANGKFAVAGSYF